MDTYTTGSYFKDSTRHSEDAEYKVQHSLPLLEDIEISTVADVGCGSGAIAARLAAHYRVIAYDISPHVLDLNNPQVRFVHGDFSHVGENVDLVTMFDVFEHVTDPVRFIRKCSQRCRYMLFHIPLDHTSLNSLRCAYLQKLSHPGHLVFLNTVSALNLLANSGLRVMRYRYSPSFRFPSCRRTRCARALNLLRGPLYRLSPALTAQLLGNVSLVVLAKCERQGEPDR